MPSGQVPNVSNSLDNSIMLACAENQERIKFQFAKAVDHVPVVNLKDWFEC